MNPKLLEDLVSLAGAGVRCTGSERDEFLVKTVVHVLSSTTKYKLWASAGGLSPLRTQLQILDCADSGRFANSWWWVYASMCVHICRLHACMDRWMWLFRY